MATREVSSVMLVEARDLLDLQPVGEGGYGMVFKARNKELGTVAYKKLRSEYIKNKTELTLIKEAEIQSKLDHPNIVKFLAMVLEPGSSYGLVLEYMEYGEILNFVQEFEPPWERKLIMIQDIVSGVCYLHSLNPSIIHGDLKPQNILLSGDLQAKICDFGFAEWKEYCNSHSGHEIRLGTIPYVPPETWEDRFLRKNEQFDVYSIGICIWEILVVRKPYEIMLPDVIRESVLSGKRPDLKLIPPEVSNKISKLIERCWDQIATNRPTAI